MMTLRSFLVRCVSNAALAVLALLFVACTDPGLCHEDTHPHAGGVYFNYDWSGMENGDLYANSIDSMQVLAVRVINHNKYGMVVGTRSPGLGHYFYNTPEEVNPYVEPDTTEVIPPPPPIDSTDIAISTDPENPPPGIIGPDPDINKDPEPEPEPEPEPPLPADQVLVDHFKLGKGVYKFFTMPIDTSEVTYTNIHNYLSSPGDGMQATDIQVAYRSYHRTDTLLRRMGGEWTDYNPAFEYIQPEFKQILVDSLDFTDIEQGHETRITFRPHPITQNIDIYLTIKKVYDGVPFVIDTVWAEISGIPSKAYLFSGHLYLAKTRKMQFATEFIDASGQPKADTETSDSVRVHANINVLSIMNAAGPEYQTGPGFLQLRIKAHADRVRDDGRVIRYNAVFQTKTNLYHDLMRAKLIEYDPYMQWARRASDHGVIDVSTLYTIFGTSIMDKKASGIDVWVESNTEQEVEI